MGITSADEVREITDKAQTIIDNKFEKSFDQSRVTDLIDAHIKRAARDGQHEMAIDIFTLASDSGMSLYRNEMTAKLCRILLKHGYDVEVNDEARSFMYIRWSKDFKNPKRKWWPWTTS